MGAWFFITMVAMQVLFLPSIAFWFYWLTTLYLNYTVRKTNCTPGSLFASAVIIQLPLFPLIFCSLGVLSAAVPLGMVIPFVGLIGWVVLGVKRYRSRSTVRAFRNECPLPKMQCSMLDIYSGVLYFALAMTICTAGSQAIAGEIVESTVFPVAAYLLVVTYLGFYASLDVLRRASIPPSRKRRFWTIIGVMLAFSLSYIVGALIAWRAWQKALQTVQMEDWQKRRVAVQERAVGGDVAS